MKVNGKMVWITGASSGIGEALAYAMSAKGASLILTARNIKKLEEVKVKCEKEYKGDGQQQVEVLPFDVIEHDRAAEIVKKAIAFAGRVDIFVHNAGISQRATAMDTTLVVEKRIIDVNYFGGVALTKELLPYMVKQKAGQFVIMSSVMGKFGTPWRSSYSASKHALHGYYDSLRAEMNPDEITVTIICPGYVNTNVTLNALKGDGAKNDQYSKASQNGYSPMEFARKALKAIEQDKFEVIIARKEKVGIWVKRFFPTIFTRLIRKMKFE